VKMFEKAVELNLHHHVHLCIAIPPEHPVASVIGLLKGKSATAVARLSGQERNFTGEHLWARGYAVSTVGFELEQVRSLHPRPRRSRWSRTLLNRRQ
jgi:putative transposase